MNTIHGLTRTPYYPELAVFNRNEADICALVLSVLLYWHSLDEHQRFNSRKHQDQLARNLRVDTARVFDVLEYLTKLRILRLKTQCHETLTGKNKEDRFYTLDFHELSQKLQAQGLNVPVKVLRHASDDSYEMYTYLSPRLLPKTQGLLGQIKGADYERATIEIARIICGICAEDDYEDFSYKALAPGWRMLAQPPVTPDELAARWLRAGERAIDLDLGDGSFFLPDGDYFGTSRHHVWHTGSKTEPQVLTAALYLALTAICDSVFFVSDLKIEELEASFVLLKHFTGMNGKLHYAYFENLDLTGAELERAQKKYAAIIDGLS
ncbi:MAG: hypothetical protein J6M93_02275 [Succinivibrio sp.]|nr:hypothetical protein [Succinivibrio sp.]